jgi:hypothetical protein
MSARLGAALRHIWRAVRDAGPDGLSREALLAMLPMRPQRMSHRVHDLKAQGYIQATGSNDLRTYTLGNKVPQGERAEPYAEPLPGWILAPYVSELVDTDGDNEADTAPLHKPLAGAPGGVPNSVFALGQVAGRLGWDQETMMPRGAADHRAEEGGHGQDGEGADELGLGGGAQQDQPADRTHEGAGRALGDPGGHERRKGSGQAAGGGGQGGVEDGRDEDPTGAEPVGGPAADRQEDGGGQHVEGDGEVQPERLDDQGDGHGGQGVCQDRGVEGLHEQGPADDGRDPPVRRRGDGRGRLWEGHVDRGT